MKAITAKEAHKLSQILGIDIDDSSKTFYATDDEESEIWSFDTKKERDSFVGK